MSLVLYRKYRPSSFDQVVGQEHVVRTIKNAIKNGNVSHAYLFSGPRGTGKTSIARIIAKTVNCKNPKDGAPCNECENCVDIANGNFLDLMEIDAATHTQVDKMRDIIERINFAPSKGKKKVYIIDEVHMLSKGAFNALLKTLEEPPEHVIFILATTEIHKIPATIISRCQRFDFRHLRVEEIKERLAEIVKAEKIEVEDGVLEYVAVSSGGGMRDSESLMGQIISLQDDSKITLKEVQEILAIPEATVFLDIIKMVLGREYNKAIFRINEVSDDGYDLSELNKGIVEYMRRILLLRISPEMREHFSSQMTDEQISELINISKNSSLVEIFKIIGSFIKSQGGIKMAILPQLPLEMAIAEIRISMEGEEALTGGQNKAYNSKVDQPQAKAKEVKKEVDNPIEIKEEIKEEEEEQEEVAEENKEEIVENNEEEIQTEETSGEKEFTGANLSLDDIESEWSDIVEDVRKCNNSLVACLKTCQPVDFQNGNILVACQYSFHKEKLEKPNNKKEIEKVICSELKCEGISLKFISREEAEKMGYEAKKMVVEEKKSEDLVNSALNMFGGELVTE